MSVLGYLSPPSWRRVDLGTWLVKPWVRPLRFERATLPKGAAAVTLLEPSLPDIASPRERTLRALWYAHAGASGDPTYYMAGIYHELGDPRVTLALDLFGLALRLLAFICDAAKERR